MKRPTAYTLALGFMLAALVAFLIAMRPECNCTLGAHDSFAPEDCPIHGSEAE